MMGRGGEGNGAQMACCMSFAPQVVFFLFLLLLYLQYLTEFLFILGTTMNDEQKWRGGTGCISKPRASYQSALVVLQQCFTVTVVAVVSIAKGYLLHSASQLYCSSTRSSSIALPQLYCSLPQCYHSATTAYIASYSFIDITLALTSNHLQYQNIYFKIYKVVTIPCRLPLLSHYHCCKQSNST